MLFFGFLPVAVHLFKTGIRNILSVLLQLPFYVLKPSGKFLIGSSQAVFRHKSIAAAYVNQRKEQISKLLLLSISIGTLQCVFKLPEFFLQLFRSEEHTSELQSRFDLVCRLLLAK